MKVGVEEAVGALNGLIGDYLHRTENALATELTLVSREGEPLAPAGLALPTRRVALYVHGLMATESCFWSWGGSHCDALQERCGLSPLFVRYNSGRHISENGRALDALLTTLVTHHALDELVVVGHSMGGLVLRSAMHFGAGFPEGLSPAPPPVGASPPGPPSRDAARGAPTPLAGFPEAPAAWLPLVQRAFYLGSPHLGAPLERVGNAVTWALKKTGVALSEPITELVADVLALRSRGIKDLRYGNLRDEDWHGRDLDALLRNGRHPVPLLPSIRHHLVAGVLPEDPRLAALLGDSLVTPKSALGRAEARDRSPAFPQEHVRIFPKLSHMDLLASPDVTEVLVAWLMEAP
jgi:pimeloyl-ACP methyl ester carboxylesterase